jgi:hypothetical protein
MRVWSRLRNQRRDARVVFVVADPAIAAHACRSAPRGVQLVVDRGGATASQYNAFWRPRAYALDAAGRLAYIQPMEASETQALRDVELLWKRGG